MFKLNVIKAYHGDCFLLEYGSKEEPRFIVIDCGPRYTYKKYLAKEIHERIQNKWQLDLVVNSHIDRDHIKGLLDFLKEIRKDKVKWKENPVNEIWFNSFSRSVLVDEIKAREYDSLAFEITELIKVKRGEEAEDPTRSYGEGFAFKEYADILNIPINKEFGNETITIENCPKTIIKDNLKITIIGPSEAELQELKTAWSIWYEDKYDPVHADFDIDDPDTEPPNISSIMFLAEAESKTILFTGDGRADLIFDNLEEKGLLDAEGKMYVDILKIPHHGSDRNVSKEFFKQILAKSYVLSGDETLGGNPEFETMEMIVLAAKDLNRKIDLFVTYKTNKVKKLLSKYPPEDHGYTLTHIEENETKLEIDLIG